MARSSDAQGAVEFFEGREADYLKWMQDHPEGFVANMDRSGHVQQYPMIHRANHRLMWSPKIGNFTTEPLRLSRRLLLLRGWSHEQSKQVFP